MDKDRLTDLLLWAWVAAVTAAYLFQFRGIAGAALKVLGLS